MFPQFASYDLPRLVSIDEVDWAKAALDLAFCALPHATTQKVLKDLVAKAPDTKVVDLSADFRLEDPAAYAKWYGHEHHALELQKEAVYGLVEVYRRDIKKARLVANPGCYTTCALLPLIPLLKAKAIEPDEIVVDAKSGVTGAGRSVKEEMLFTEVSEGFHAYGVGHHRHMSELDQEFSKAAGKPVVVSFTPHLLPMNRGLLSTIYVRGRRGKTAQDLHEILAKAYAQEAVRPCIAVRQDAANPARPRFQHDLHRRRRRSDRGTGDPGFGAGQHDQGRLGSGGAEHEPDARFCRDHGHRPAGDVSMREHRDHCRSSDLRHSGATRTRRARNP